MQFGRLGQMTNQTCDHRRLPQRKFVIYLLGCILRGPPHGPGIVGGHERESVDAGHGGYLAAQRRLIQKIALPGTTPAWTQRILVNSFVSQFFLDFRSAQTQDFIQG